MTPSPQGELCVAKLFPPKPSGGKGTASDPGHGTSAPRTVRCEASRNLKWSIANTGVMSPIYKLSLPSPDSADLPLFQISKPNPNAVFWSMFYFAYAGHNIPPKRIEFGKIQKNPPGPGGGGTRISITGKSPEEKAVWQTLGEGNEDCVEWVVLCAVLNLLDDEIMKAAEKNPGIIGGPVPHRAGTVPPQGVGLRDPGPASPGALQRGPPPHNQQQQQQRPPPPTAGPGGPPPQMHPAPNPGSASGPSRPVPQHQQTYPGPGISRGFPPNGPPPQGHPQGPPQGYPLQGPPLNGYPLQQQQYQHPPPQQQRGFPPGRPGVPTGIQASQAPPRRF